MQIEIGDYTARGPYETSDYLPYNQGVYIVLCVNTSNGEAEVIDVGESKNIRQRIETHDRASEWSKNCSYSIQVAFISTDTEARRMQIENELRKHFNPVCGER